MYTYFVSYHHFSSSSRGQGMCEVILQKEIKSFDDITYVSELIADKNSVKQVVIINYKLLGEKENG
jgi:hypothetical protein